jgi:hypothetical protein
MMYPSSFLVMNYYMDCIEIYFFILEYILPSHIFDPPQLVGCLQDGLILSSEEADNPPLCCQKLPPLAASLIITVCVHGGSFSQTHTPSHTSTAGIGCSDLGG